MTSADGGGPGHPEVVPDVQHPQPLDDQGRSLLTAELADQPVQRVVELGVLQVVAVGYSAGHPVAQRGQVHDALVGDPVRRLRRALDGLGLAASDLTKILSGNALRLFPRAAAHLGAAHVQ